MTARLHIDRTRCAGHGICVLLAGAVLELDVWGFPELLADELDNPDELRQARRAAAACPRQALTLQELPPPAAAGRAPWGR